MFKISKDDSFFWPVTIEVPMDGGRFQKVSFEAKFKRVSRTRYEDMLAQARENNLKDVDLCREVVCGFKGVGDENSQPLEYNETNRDLLFEDALAVRAMALAYIEAMSGIKRKN